MLLFALDQRWLSRLITLQVLYVALELACPFLGSVKDAFGTLARRAQREWPTSSKGCKQLYYFPNSHLESRCLGQQSRLIFKRTFIVALDKIVGYCFA